MRSISRIAALAFAATISSAAFAADPEWMKAVGEALGKTGSAMPGGIYRVGLPRSDLKVSLEGVEIKPALALGSWLAFKKTGNQGMVMGDLVLLISEVTPVMTKLEESGIEVTALHNHLLRNEPFTIARHALPGAKHNHGLLIEPKQRLAIIACEGNNKLLVVDMQSMRVI